MPLYEDSKYHPLFIGDMHPVKLMDGNKVVFEPNVSELSGEGLSVNKTYNDSAFVRINGKTVEIGEGDKSPDNPYELKSVGDDGGFDLVSAGKNLFDMNRYHSDYVVDNTITYTQADFVAVHNIFADFNFKANTRYTLSLHYHITSTDLVQGNGIVIQFLDENKAVISSRFLNTGTNGTIVGDTTLTNGVSTSIKYVRLSYTSSKRNCSVILSNIQLELGSTATPYTPFRGMQTVHIPYTLRSLPDGTKDYIEIDNVAKTAKLYRNVEKHIFTGDESIGYRSDIGNLDGYSRFTFPVSGRVAGNDAMLCSHFSPISSYTVQSNGFRNISAWIEFQIENSTIGAVDGDEVADLRNKFNSLLAAQYAAGTPVTVQYKLAEPIITELDYTAVRTYYPYTNIYTISTVQPTLDGNFRVWGS